MVSGRRAAVNAGAGRLSNGPADSFEQDSMPTIIKHRKIRIVTLKPGETVPEQCRAGDIAIVQDGAGWWTDFVGEGGAVERYDAPFDSYDKALWAAKAAAEFSAE